MIHDYNPSAIAANALTALFASVSAFMFALSDQVITAIIAGAVVVIPSLAATYYSYRAKIASEEGKAISEETGKAVNGKMIEMTEVVKKMSRAEGVVEGEAKAEQKAAVIAVAKVEGKVEAVKEQAKE